MNWTAQWTDYNNIGLKSAVAWWRLDVHIPLPYTLFQMDMKWVLCNGSHYYYYNAQFFIL